MYDVVVSQVESFIDLAHLKTTGLEPKCFTVFAS